MKYIIVITLLVCTYNLSAQDCCSDASCRKRTMDLVGKMNTVLLKLDKPENVNYTFEELVEIYADSLNDYEISTFEQIYKQLRQQYFPNADLTECLETFIDEDPHIFNWYIYFRSLNTPSTELPSPNFRNRYSIFLNTNMFGVADLFKETESYMANFSLLLGTTLGGGKNEEPKFRILVGATSFYQNTDLYYLITSRLAYKIIDIEPSLVNIGALKVHIQSNFNRNIFMLETGISFETYGIGINILNVGYQSGLGDYYLYSGFSFNLVEIF